MTPPISPTGHAVLGLLRLRSWTTYELAKQVQRSLRWFWPRAERKLYDEPKRLVAAGLAKSTRQMTGSRASTVYSVTAQGRKELQRWLDAPPAPPALEFEGLMKVFFADGGTVEQLRTTLTRIAETSDARMAELDVKVDEHARRDVPFPERIPINLVALQFQIEHERVFGNWARWALDEIADWKTV